MVPPVSRALSLTGLLPILVLLVLAPGAARADEAPPAPAPAPATAPATAPDPSGPPSASEPGGSIVPDDPGCVGRFPGQPCPLFREGGAGGQCVRALCGTEPGRPCLRCVPTSNETRVETPWIPMISFGVVVALVGFVFWFRLKKAWG